MNSVALIIPAAGSGERLNRPMAKPYIEIAGKTILEHTLQRFLPFEEVRQVLVPTSPEYLGRARAILRQIVPERVHFTCLEGGGERQDSIRKALDRVEDVELVAVHDAVRPFVSRQAIEDCIAAAAESGGALVGVPAKDTIKKVDGRGAVEETPDRKTLWQAQTPQIFRRDILVKAYREAEREGYLGTDDASLVERLGYSVKVVEGGRDNFKITYPVDLKLATLLLEEEQ